MEKKIKILYILSIISILAFLGMQGYWLYSRYEYSLWEYKEKAADLMEESFQQYNIQRNNPKTYDTSGYRSSYNMTNSVDSTGNPTRNVTITVKTYNAKKLLGINEARELTDEEKEYLEKYLADSIANIEEKKATMDVSSAPSETASWGAMKNYELEMLSPFTPEGLDSVLRKVNIDSKITLEVSDTLLWKPISTSRTSIFNPRFIYKYPYSELEGKIAVVDCRIPTAEVIKEMGWTLALAFTISMILILCLVWQIKTIVKLTRLDKMRNMFITTMIHELKRPISTLKMCVSGIENEKMLADKEIKAELMSGTRTALDNLSAYFSKLRDITFNNVEQIPLNVTKFNVTKLVDDVISSVALTSFKSVSFKNTVDQDIEISADRTHIYNIINNLIENAIKYSGNEVEIRIEAYMNDNDISIAVSDTGNGIPESDYANIFKRFYRGRASSTDIPGMGIGLSYVKLLTEAHGGTITVSSKLNSGTTFTIILPQ